MPRYVVERTQPTVYVGRSGRPVNGFLVYVTLLNYDETHELRVETLDPETVGLAVDQLITQRRALAELGA